VSPEKVIVVTVIAADENDNGCRRWRMPILMVALLALAVFGMMGILLLTAVILENRMRRKQTEARKPPLAGFPLVKH
jgi:hypothetical protein